MRYLLTVVLLPFLTSLQAQQPRLQLLESGKKISIRGLSVVSDQVIWASGSKGSVARSIDGGKTFNWIQVPGYEKNDFRDIEAFDEKTALVMGITEPAVILKTVDGGQSWKKVFEDTTKGAFFDAMDFQINEQKDTLGVVIGDPINGKIFYARSFDFGKTWETSSNKDTNLIPSVTDGEAFFASSGTNISFLKTSDLSSPLYAVSGGKASHLWDMNYWKKYPLPIMQGGNSTGANSLAISPDNTKGMVVGGDFTKDSIQQNNAVMISFAGSVKMSIPQTPPHGYRSCVIYLTKNQLLTCGTSGIDLSNDGGNNWTLLSTESYHVCQKAKKGKSVFLAGANGKIAKLIFP